ncbi:PfkB family carbohydrate kinase [Pseudonocardia humida]|uniref:Ribokinase n=1 Tax=Pseudonocardia humida TaxID=2800819 RepID=A0ABT0ZYN5_9PSEU|nr:PfkB family carbohydrate kinase [Pseudonocardia humida]MCO1655790.1 ribokinase [Pseudonocardia humida]
MDARVVVVGSLNADLAVPVAGLPPAGQTVAATGEVLRGPGGKGANQAVGLARLGRATAMVGAVGDDAEGRTMRAALAAEGVDDRHVATVDVPTGLAVVLVHGGESTIVVAAGANGTVDADRVRAARAALAGAAAVVTQCEVPDSAIAAAAELAGGLFVVNPAPARALPAAVLDRADLLVPNRGELATLAGAEEPRGTDAVADLARALRPSATTVVTCGAEGAVVVGPDRVVAVPAAPARLVDATAAGDSFVAALVDALVGGADVVEATGWAARAAAITVGRPGAIAALPRRAEL